MLYLAMLYLNKMLPVDPVFSSWVYVIKKAPIINLSGNSKSLKDYFFFCEIRKLRFFQQSQYFLKCLLAFITLFQYSIGYVIFPFS